MTHCEAAAIAARWHFEQAKKRAIALTDDTNRYRYLPDRTELQYAMDLFLYVWHSADLAR